ncbi:MAG: septum formation initiator family protein [Myxococcota bacterium]
MKALCLGILLIAVLAVTALLDPNSGMGIWWELRGDLADSSQRISGLLDENEALRREIEILEAEPEALDRAIREELGLALPGEVIVRFASAGTNLEMK